MYLWWIIILRSGSFATDTAGDKKNCSNSTQCICVEQILCATSDIMRKYHIYPDSERSCEVEGGNAQQFLTDQADEKIMTGLKM